MRWVPAERIRRDPRIARLGRWLARPGVWRFNRRAVARGLAVGLFVAFIPLPGQMLLAGLGACWSNSNLPVSVSAVWLTNPITMPPLFFFAYRVGVWALGAQAPMPGSWSWDALWGVVQQAWLPFLTGCLIVGLAAAVLGYLFVEISWRVAVWRRWRRRMLASA